MLFLCITCSLLPLSILSVLSILSQHYIAEVSRTPEKENIITDRDKSVESYANDFSSWLYYPSSDSFALANYLSMKSYTAPKPGAGGARCAVHSVENAQHQEFIQV